MYIYLAEYDKLTLYLNMDVEKSWIAPLPQKSSTVESYF